MRQRHQSEQTQAVVRRGGHGNTANPSKRPVPAFGGGEVVAVSEVGGSPGLLEQGEVKVLSDVVGEMPDEVVLQDVYLGDEQKTTLAGCVFVVLCELEPLQSPSPDEIPSRRLLLGT